jgi:GTP-binding protein
MYSKVKSPFPTISIIGRPNVGKSTLFNRIVGRRQSIVQEESGTTRDRVISLVTWEGKTFNLTDTGGMRFEKKSSLEQTIDREVEKAIEVSQVLIFVVDGKSGIRPLDEVIAEKIRSLKKQVLIAVNKVDIDSSQCELPSFYKLGLGEPYPLSALHGIGIGDILDPATRNISKAKETILTPNFTLSIVGEPNAGKSTLLNSFLEEDRAIVSDVAGTTRDSIEETIRYKTHYIRIVDTAGMRHKRKIKDVSTFFSLSRAKKSIQHSDATYLLFDAHKGIHRDTKAIARFLEEERKPVILVANKWDLVKGREQARYEMDMKKELRFLSRSPLMFISAKNKRNLHQLLDQGINLWQRSTHHISTSKLNDFLSRIKRRKLPVPTIKLKFLTLTSAVPQEFICFAKNKHLIPEHYKRFIENELTEEFNLNGIPIRLFFKEVDKRHD